MSEIVLTSEITVRLIDKMGGDHAVVAAARVSTSGEESLRWRDAPAEDNYGLIRYLMRHRHATPFEHSAVTLFAHAPAFVWWEWVRHRWMSVDCGEVSFNLESGRYRELQPVFWVPRRDRRMLKGSDYKPARPQFTNCGEEQYHDTLQDMEQVHRKAWLHYQRMLKRGIGQEVARSVLGFGIYYSGWVTCHGCRTLMHFLSLRTHEPQAAFVSYPQAEIEEAARATEAIFAAGWPLTYKAFCENGRVAP